MADLKDPALPAGAIVATHEDDESLEDGQVRRNDGVELEPAAKNPWYVLATVAGEQGDIWAFLTEDDLHTKNRRFWNGWMCQDISDADRAALAQKLDLDAEELKPLSEDEKTILNTRFAEAFPEIAENERLPAPEDVVDMAGLHFPSTLALGKCHFASSAYFGTAHFAGAADFRTAHFAGRAFFRTAHFAGAADFETARFAERAAFETAHFAGHAVFLKAHFTGHAVFRTAHFAGDAFFQTAHFAGDAFFQTAHFAGDAIFKDCVFGKHLDFSNGTFKSRTDFLEANFETRVPKFYQREMHQDTRFSDQPKFWPAVTSDNAEPGKKAYTRLRQVAAEVYDPDLEHFFLRQEMRCKELIEQDKGAWFHAWFFAAYRVIADSGISVARPSFALALLVAVPWGIIGSWLSENGSETPIAEGFGVSLGNTLPFLGLVRKMHPDFYKEAPWWLDALSGAQSLTGIVLLFFLGLGLRNRFRLK